MPDLKQESSEKYVTFMDEKIKSSQMQPDACTNLIIQSQAKISPFVGNTSKSPF